MLDGMADVDLSTKIAAGGTARPSFRRVYLSAERTRQADWQQLARDAGAVVNGAVVAGTEARVAPGQVPHDVVIRYATQFGALLARAYEIGAEDGHGRRAREIVDGTHFTREVP